MSEYCSSAVFIMFSGNNYIATRAEDLYSLVYIVSNNHDNVKYYITFASQKKTINAR